ncbi:hypothetical protein VNO78_07577 [Psophocarpus tetragonolobus]|uniref:Uncharacterized protein n=1 Tax=Psophocarpus tetragonolobus TaxID=3891 RepID=A0AAN9SWD8_PSOTE
MKPCAPILVLEKERQRVIVCSFVLPQNGKKRRRVDIFTDDDDAVFLSVLANRSAENAEKSGERASQLGTPTVRRNY